MRAGSCPTPGLRLASTNGRVGSNRNQAAVSHPHARTLPRVEAVQKAAVSTTNRVAVLLRCHPVARRNRRADHETMNRPPLRLRLLIVLVAGVLGRGVSAEPVSVAELTAAFLYNFARFAEWPPEAVSASAPIGLCVVGDAEVAESLGQAVRGKSIEGHALVLRRPSAGLELRACQLLYLGGDDIAHAREVLDAVRDAPVLTISSQMMFTAIGGTAELFMDGERMRFAVNVAAADRARIRISAQLLSLAKIVRDDDDAPN